MKKKIGILALVIAIAMCFFTISAFAISEENRNSQMPFVDSDQISPEYPDVQTEADLMEDFEEIFGEGGKEFFIAVIIGTLFSLLFFPALIIAIVFAVLHSNAKKKVKEYERFFGPISQNSPRYYNPNVNNMVYQSQPVNPTGVPMGTAPIGNPYVPQNDINNQQGGQF
ncbi:MAG: hypothetical protein E7529_01215 [Ruminococcaceae bacterium]|nr:hypothetical protein [Oscillospiraceae bacterium]